MTTDFGPVPASQVKAEANRIFSALEEGRRVLISRYGKVVAVVDPPSPSLHGHMLVAFAIPSLDMPRELTATEISQGAPGEHIRLAEEGSASLVTRNNKVYGVLTSYSGDPTAPDADEEERLLSAFEEAHPDATPAEFAAEVERLKVDHARELQATNWLGTPRRDLAQMDDDAADTRLWGDATLIEAVALEQKGEFGPARMRLVHLINRLGGQEDRSLRRRVHLAQVELARMHVSAGNPDAALSIAADVLADLRLSPSDTTTSAVVPRSRTHYEPA